MHEFLLKSFIKSKSFVQFLKIFDVFLIMMLLLHWIEHLLGSTWGWMNFIKPLLDFFIITGAMINNGSADFFGAVFEYKFFIALILLIVVYFLIHLDYLLICFIESAYKEGHFHFNRFQEKVLNKKLQDEQVCEQKKLQSYVIYISGVLKTDAVTKLSNVNLEEQINLMNKFLIEKTGTSPQKFDNGFVYKFYKFDKIDYILDIFFRVLHSTAPLNFQICVILEEHDKTLQDERLRSLIHLGIMNKISMLSNIAYRYKFIENPKYETSMLGVFQKNNNTIEVHSFIEPFS